MATVLDNLLAGYRDVSGQHLKPEDRHYGDGIHQIGDFLLIIDGVLRGKSLDEAVEVLIEGTTPKIGKETSVHGGNLYDKATLINEFPELSNGSFAGNLVVVPKVYYPTEPTSTEKIRDAAVRCYIYVGPVKDWGIPAMTVHNMDAVEGAIRAFDLVQKQPIVVPITDQSSISGLFFNLYLLK